MSCQCCQEPLTDKQDKVHLAGSCGHQIHLVCYEKYKSVGLRGCCPGSGDLGETLKARIYNPLGNAAPPPVSGSTETGWRGVLDAVWSLDKRIDLTLEQTPHAAIRAKTAVSNLIGRGIDAVTIVQASKAGDVLITDLAANYSTAEIKALGFTWDALVDVGLSLANWDRDRLTVGELKRDLGVQPMHLFHTFCTDNEARLPDLELSAEEWQTLCSPATPISFFKQVRVTPDTIVQFGYRLNDWHHKLGLTRSPVKEFGLTAEQCWEWIRAGALDQEAASSEFTFLFKEAPPNERAGSGRVAGRGARAAPAPARGPNPGAVGPSWWARGRGAGAARVAPPARRGKEEGLKLKFVHLNGDL